MSNRRDILKGALAALAGIGVALPSFKAMAKPSYWLENGVPYTTDDGILTNGTRVLAPGSPDMSLPGVPGPSAQSLIRKAHAAHPDYPSDRVSGHLMTDYHYLPAEFVYDDDCILCRWTLAGQPPL